MQGRGGFDVVRYLREYLSPPFVFLASPIDSATLAGAEDLGAAACVLKPLGTPDRACRRSCAKSSIRPA